MGNFMMINIYINSLSVLYKSILLNTFVIYVPIHRRTILRTLNTWYEN